HPPGCCDFLFSNERRSSMWRSTGAALAAPLGQLVPRLWGGIADLGAFLGRDHTQGFLQLAPDVCQSKAEHALSALHEVDDLLGRGAFVDADPVTHEGDACQVLSGTTTQMVHRGTDLLQ